MISKYIKKGGKYVMGNEGAELWNPISDRQTIPMRRGKMAVVIDRKFKFKAVSIKSGKTYTEYNGILFLAKDALLPLMLDHYLVLLEERKADQGQLMSVRLLKDRVVAWQAKNSRSVKLADVEKGKEEMRLCKPNK